MSACLLSHAASSPISGDDWSAPRCDVLVFLTVVKHRAVPALLLDWVPNRLAARRKRRVRSYPASERWVRPGVQRIELLAPDVAFVDTDVRLERRADDGSWPTVRRFTNYTVAIRDGDAWRIKEVRTHVKPDTAAPAGTSAPLVQPPIADGSARSLAISSRSRVATNSGVAPQS